MLGQFIADHRREILSRARSRVAKRNTPVATEADLTHSLPIFFEQLEEALRKATSGEDPDSAEINETACQRGCDLFRQGLTVAQVVHGYGDICQVITSLAEEESAPIAPSDFRTLGLCLEDAIAGAVTEFERQRERSVADQSTERIGELAHEMRNLLSTAMMSFASIKSGIVAVAGSTAALHERSLVRLHALIDSSLADVRLDAGLQNLERVPVCELIEDVEAGASMLAQARGLGLTVATVDHSVVVQADRQILASAITNLLQNAFKFTRRQSTVRLTASATSTRVLIEVEDECGGLPPDAPATLLQPFVQKGHDRTGLGLGLSICRKAVLAIGGDLRIRDVPGKGCVFTIDLPKQLPPASLRAPRLRKATPGKPGAAGALARRMAR